MLEGRCVATCDMLSPHVLQNLRTPQHRRVLPPPAVSPSQLRAAHADYRKHFVDLLAAGHINKPKKEVLNMIEQRCSSRMMVSKHTSAWCAKLLQGQVEQGDGAGAWHMLLVAI